ncbi:gp593 [Bacillus phage G]|uniref:Gp593 n=1 Tax=Bacillus phage G TaxID=2884420 RepID=G3MAX3_9CAUD|nr:gp593 [Bacillus phage G]AEO93838.1 gp593 [Bacillus phage G]
MKIKPIPFNYGLLVKDFPGTEVKVQRKNVVVDNDIIGMWGENIDEENQIMLLTNISVKREHSKNSKENLISLWESTFNQYATDEQPEEILARIQERQDKEAERMKKAEEAAKKAEEKAKALKDQIESKENKAKEQVS